MASARSFGAPNARRAKPDGRAAPQCLLWPVRSRPSRPGAVSDHVDTWIFDLDNTLYPASCNLFAEVDQRMGEFIAKAIGVPFEHARHLQKAYYRQFGTTLAGLMQVHKLPPGPFLEYVHDIDLSVVPELPELAAAIAALPGRRLIFHQWLAPPRGKSGKEARRVAPL